jgi:hypothetical protein
MIVSKHRMILWYLLFCCYCQSSESFPEQNSSLPRQYVLVGHRIDWYPTLWLPIVHKEGRALALVTTVDPSPTMSSEMCESRYVDLAGAATPIPVKTTRKT